MFLKYLNDAIRILLKALERMFRFRLSLIFLIHIIKHTIQYMYKVYLNVKHIKTKIQPAHRYMFLFEPIKYSSVSINLWIKNKTNIVFLLSNVPSKPRATLTPSFISFWLIMKGEKFKCDHQLSHNFFLFGRLSFSLNYYNTLLYIYNQIQQYNMHQKRAEEMRATDIAYDST